jgi:hypothetical protein
MICTHCNQDAELKVFSTFQYYYCHQCKDEVRAEAPSTQDEVRAEAPSTQNVLTIPWGTRWIKDGSQWIQLPDSATPDPINNHPMFLDPHGRITFRKGTQ